MTIKITTILALTLKSSFLGKTYYNIWIETTFWYSHVEDFNSEKFSSLNEVWKVFTAFLRSELERSWQFPKIDTLNTF